MNKQPVYINNQIYHLFNRGVAKQPIFKTASDYQRLLDTFAYYLEDDPEIKISARNKKDVNRIIASPVKNPLIQIFSFSLMPNHFHLLARQNSDRGISIFAQRALNSYTKSFNTKYDRVGTIFQGKLKRVLIEDDDQLLHLSRYIHLNPYVDNLADKPEDYDWSSYKMFLANQKNRLCDPELVLSIIGSKKDYKKFVEDYADYAKSLSLIKHSQLE